MFVLFELYFSVHFLCTLFAIKFLFTDKKKKKDLPDSSIA
jgi:hypothetical protein